MDSKSYRRGGHFLVYDPAPEEIFIREDFGEEQKMMFQAAADFMKTEVEPHLLRFEQGDYALVEELMRKAGQLGLLGLSVPESYGGLGMGFNVSMLICEEISSMTGSLATAFGAHTGIGTLPIQYYGSNAIKERFLGKIASGEWISCYNLTEPRAGSDANAGKTSAVLSTDGQHYEITGQKIWISNAGFAQVFIVFARIENDKNVSCFVFHRDDVQGLTFNAEEHKMGIKSSSTRQVFYDKVKVPATSMLGQRGDGFKIAVNVLNAGRIKLAAATNGAAFKVIGLMSRYANERHQFGQPIGAFGAIQEKIARCSALVYATDAALYRAGDAIEKLQNALLAEGKTEAEAKLKGLEEFAVECAILKVYGSEVMALVADEGVQVYGGMGYSADAPMEAAYRDARISRIYEGTNEINRMLIVDMMLRKALKGHVDLLGPARRVAGELMEIPDFGAEEPTDYLASEAKVLKQLKKAGLLVAGAAVQHYGTALAEEQEALMRMADMAMEVYVLESALLKTLRLHERLSDQEKTLWASLVTLQAHHAAEKCLSAGREVIHALPENDEQKMMLMGLRRFTKTNPVNLKNLRRSIARFVLEKGQYPF
ncbi:MAG: acyl-CoA dehydrogenase family protein [Bacteroidia bacterium]